MKDKSTKRVSHTAHVCIRAAVALVACWLIALCSATNTHVAAQSGNPTMHDPNLAVRPLLTGLVTPISLAFLGANEMLILEKNTGKVQHIVNGAFQNTALDLAVNASSERGLLGITLDPGFANNHFVYLYWTCRAPHPSDPFTPSLVECPDPPELGADSTDILEVPLLGNRVDRFVWNGTGLTFDRNLIKLHAFQNDGAPTPPGQGDAGQPPAGNHNGGVITFGPDGKLYIIIGDNGRRGQLQNLPSGPTATGLGPTVPDDQFGGPAPDRAHFTGVIIRLNSDGSTPADNPFFAAGGSIGGEVGQNIQKIFSYGHRNSFGMAFDPLSGNLWMSENGDDSFDEINRIAAGTNSGWIQIMGPLARLNQFKAIETDPEFFGLQQERWPPSRIADTASEALSRLFVLPGSQFHDPEFSWKYAMAPAAIGFLNSSNFGPAYQGNLFVGFSEAEPVEGPLFRFRLTGDRQMIAVDDPKLSDRVADNIDKHDLTESESLLIGEGFGIITDIKTAPNGNLYVVSLDKGTLYEIFNVQTARTRFSAHLTGDQEVPPVNTAAQGTATFQLSKDGTQLAFTLQLSNITNVTMAHLHLAPPGVNGPIVANLLPPGRTLPGGGFLVGVIRARDLVGPLAGQPLSALIAQMEAGNVYANVHTTAHPGGEIRGQVQ
jgi:aldose sugar dehydrogenase